MAIEGLHVVFGVGQVGRSLATHLAGLGLQVRAVSRQRPTALADGIDWWAADVADVDAAAGAAKGATAVYQCLNAPYTAWAQQFPPLQRGYPAGGPGRRLASTTSRCLRSSRFI